MTRCFGNVSFVSGVILRRDRAVAHAISGWDGAEMYQRLSDQDSKEEGRKYADIEIPFCKDSANVVGLHAHTHTIQH